MDSSSSMGCHHVQDHDASHVSEEEETLEKIISRVVADCLNRKWNRDIDVSINFQREDTLANITGILHDALLRQHVRAFINEEQDQIERSLIYITVFSKDYASTESCILELDKILECREKNGQIVIPIFYGVKPSAVRGLTEIPGNSVVKHLQDPNPKVMLAKAEKWKASLTEAAGEASLTKASFLSGWVSMNIESDAKLVELFIKDILKKLVLISISMADKLVSCFDMVLNKLDSSTGAFWSNTDLRQLHRRIRDVHHLLQKARRYTFNQHRLLRQSFQNLRNHAYDIDVLVDGYEKSDISKCVFDQELRRIDGELLEFLNLFQNLVTSCNGERSAISECLLWQSPSPLPFIDCPSFSSGDTAFKDSNNLSGHHNAQSQLLETSCKFSFDEAAAADNPHLNLSLCSSGTKKTVLALEINDDRVQQRAVNIVSQFMGISCISFDRANKKMTIIGDIDAVSVVAELAKLCATELVSFGEANEPEEEEGKRNNKELKKAAEEKKDAEIVERKSRKSSNWLFSCFSHK